MHGHIIRMTKTSLGKRVTSSSTLSHCSGVTIAILRWVIEFQLNASLVFQLAIRRRRCSNRFHRLHQAILERVKALSSGYRRLLRPFRIELARRLDAVQAYKQTCNRPPQRRSGMTESPPTLATIFRKPGGWWAQTSIKTCSAAFAERSGVAPAADYCTPTSLAVSSYSTSPLSHLRSSLFWLLPNC